MCKNWPWYWKLLVSVTYIITNITDRPVRLVTILAITSVSTFKTATILYVLLFTKFVLVIHNYHKGLRLFHEKQIAHLSFNNSISTFYIIAGNLDGKGKLNVCRGPNNYLTNLITWPLVKYIFLSYTGSIWAVKLHWLDKNLLYKVTDQDIAFLIPDSCWASQRISSKKQFKLLFLILLDNFAVVLGFFTFQIR